MPQASEGSHRARLHPLRNFIIDGSYRVPAAMPGGATFSMRSSSSSVNAMPRRARSLRAARGCSSLESGSRYRVDSTATRVQAARVCSAIGKPWRIAATSSNRRDPSDSATWPNFGTLSHPARKRGRSRMSSANCCGRMRSYSRSLYGGRRGGAANRIEARGEES